MAFSPGQRKKAIAEINVTPLVDVMLVLLIIFMVTAPMMDQGIDLKLPEVATTALDVEQAQLTVSMNDQGRVFVDGQALPAEGWQDKLAAIIETRADDPVYVEADTSVPYGQVATLLGTLRQAGATKLSLVTQEPQSR